MLKFNFPLFARILVLTAFLVAAVQSSAFAGLREPLEIVNETSQPIMSLYAVPVQKKGWGNDLVGSDVMNQGDRRAIHYDSEYMHFKFKIEFADGKTIILKDVDLLDTWRISLKRDGTYDKNARG